VYCLVRARTPLLDWRVGGWRPSEYRPERTKSVPVTADPSAYPIGIFDHLIAHHCDPEGKIADNVGRLAKERYFRAVVQVPERA
jgi:hypothetical protein